MRLEFGQTLLIKSRDRLPDVAEDRASVEQLALVAGNGPRTLPTAARPDRAGEERDSSDTSRGKPHGEHDVARVRTGAHDIRDVVSYVEKHINDDRVVGRALRRVVRKGTVGEVAAFTAELIDLLRSHPETNEPG